MSKTTLNFHSGILFIFLVTCVVNSLDANCPAMQTRKRWGSRAPTKVDYQIIPVKCVVIHHTATPKCLDLNSCRSRVVNIQSYHINTLHFDDISYNFLIGNDGTIYEGVGWHRVGFHSPGYNDKSIGIAFIGSFADELPSENALQAAKNLIECGISSNLITGDHSILAASQVKSTTSPGATLQQHISAWSRYSSTVQCDF